jgi:hypothetical protein
MQRLALISVITVFLSSNIWAQSAPVVTIYTQFEEACSPAVARAIQREVGEVMRPAGIQFDWRELDSDRVGEPVDELVVLKFKGPCKVMNMVPGSDWSGALGWTHVSDGHLLPFADIDCYRTWRFIHPNVAGAPEDEQNELFGRALGRVAAHELFHILANTTRHAASGMAKGCYTSNDLIAERLQFRAKDLDLIRNGKLRAAIQRQARPTMAATAAGE